MLGQRIDLPRGSAGFAPADHCPHHRDAQAMQARNRARSELVGSRIAAALEGHDDGGVIEIGRRTTRRRPSL
jgi:hypothetical protein